MTALTRVLELLATEQRVFIRLAKYGPKQFVLSVMISDSERIAQGSGETLPEAAELLVASCERVGLLHDESPPTEPNPDAQFKGGA